MSGWLPDGTNLGPLNLVETFVFFDSPRLFSCISATGQNYIGVWVDESDEREIYLLLPVSPERLKAIRSGIISLRVAIENSESGGVYLVPLFGEDVPFAQWESLGEIPESFLPDVASYLHLETVTLPPADETREFRDRAAQQHRSLLRLAFGLDTTRNEAPTRIVGQTLVGVQELIDAIGQVQVGEPTTRGVIPEEILLGTDSMLVGAFAGSFVLELAGVSQLDLFESSLFSRSADTLIGLMRDAGDRRALGSQLLALKGRVPTKLRSFIEDVAAAKGGLTISHATPNRVLNEASLSVSQIRDLSEWLSELEIADTVRHTMNAQLIGINVRTRIYELRDEDGVKWTGRIHDSAMEAASAATVNRSYRATIEEVAESSSATGDVRTRRFLVELSTL